MDTPSKDNSIYINLSHLEQTSAYKADELIYRNERDIWAKQIRQDLKTNLNAPKEPDTQSQVPAKQPTYYIGGGRGSGKSTFLRALIDSLEHPEDQEDKKTAIMHLTTVDPTTLGSGENFFIYILSTFYEKIKSIHKDAKPWAQQSKGQLDLRKQLNELMEELTLAVKNLTNSKTSHLETIDDSWVYQDSMKLGMSSMKLRDNFRELVEKTCQFCHCDALLIGIDDADINCGKSAEVLEYLRKYMITPRLIFIFAGDMNLQEQVVRGMQWEHFNPSLFDNDKELNSQRLLLLEQMQEQYLLKLFPINNRYTLKSLDAEKLKGIKLTLNGKKEKRECLDFIQEKLKNHVGTLASHQAAIINMPKRTLFQLLKYWMEHDSGSISIVKGLQQISTYALVKYGINTNDIENGSVSALSRAVISVVSEDDDMVESASLIPVRNDERNRVYLYLSSEIARAAISKEKRLEFLLMTYSYFQAFHRFQDVFSNLDKQSQDNYFKSYINSVFSGNYTYWGRCMTAIMATIAPSGSGRNKQFRNGCIRIMKRSSVSGWKRLDKTEGEIINLYNKEKESNKKSHFMLKYYIAFINAISGVSIKNASAICISVYNVLGCLQQCISTLLSNKNKENAILEIIQPNKEWQIVKSPFSSKDVVPDDAEGDTEDKKPESDEISKITDNDTKLIVNEIIEWWNKYAKKDSLEPCFAPDFCNCWKQFTNSLSWRADSILLTVPTYTDPDQTESAKLKNSKGDPYHYVAETLDCYMRCFTEAARMHLGDDFAYFIEEFPLWEPLSPQKAAAEKYQEARDLVNKVYAGQDTKKQ